MQNRIRAVGSITGNNNPPNNQGEKKKKKTRTGEKPHLGEVDVEK